MNELKTLLKTHISSLLEEAQAKALDPNNFEMFFMFSEFLLIIDF